MKSYKIITKATGKFGVQRIGSSEIHGDFDTFAEAAEAIGMSQAADASATTSKDEY